MLAAAASFSKPHARSLIKRLLRAHLALVRGTTNRPLPPRQVLPPGLLSLLPLLLVQTRFPDVAALAAEMVGAIALCSWEANEGVASDGETLEGLVVALGRRSKRVVTAACHAVLDLSTAPIGRERLRESSAVEKLLLIFCQVATAPDNYNSTELESMNDKISALALEAAVTLINTSNDESLGEIPGELSRRFLILVKQLWARLRDSTLPRECSKQEGYACISSHDLAEAIFRLSMNQVNHEICTPDAVRRSMFGDRESDFEHFVLSYWEDSPYLMRNATKYLEDNNVIFNCLKFNTRTISAIVDSILQCSISCPPIASDELDILCFLKEVKGGLGSLMLYGQDIRVMKTKEFLSTHGQVKKEVHFFKHCTGLASIDNSAFLDNFHVQKCKEAVGDGYTIALRGLEFRFQKIAALADGLATLFGQPSVGANIYLTPPKSQGLSPHYDDHCVFVCQLFGHKRWNLLPRSTPLLPRLYDPLGSLPCKLENDGDVCEGQHFLLQEGDILYIPRGYPHEAHTTVYANESQTEESNVFSLHLTLAVEVEPPFEWEGFAHVALHCWNLKQKGIHCHPTDSTLVIPNFMIVTLLHVAIRLIGNHEPTFRKACMVGVFPLLSDGEREEDMHTLTLKQRATFAQIIDTIVANSSFSEAFKSIEAAIYEGNEDSVQWLRWLRHLPQEGNENEKFDYDNPLEAFEKIVRLFDRHIKEAEATFMQVKSKFCSYVTFEDACKSFELLQKQYKKARKQYMNGMLSLHPTL